ncbi:MAG: hypothetical protein EA387_15425 [Nitriliruptor sp.]|nr:MAG: hypothetical protein EA387_15425 [Nitriliruptor sp.]
MDAGNVPSTRRAMRRARWVVLIAAASAWLAVACTSDGDAPPPTAPAPPVEEPAGTTAVGRDVELVLPPRTALDPSIAERLSDRMRSLSEDLPDGVDSLSVRLPEEPAFVPDLLELAAARGAALACVLGPDVAGIADRTADRHGATTVCALPATLPELDEEGDFEPTPALRIDVPVTELGVLVGTAARTAVLTAVARADPDGDGPDADGTDPDADEPAAPAAEVPRVGLVLLGDELPSDRLREGVLTGLAGIEMVEVEDADASPLEALETLLATGVQVVIVDGGPGAAEVVAALSGRSAIVAPVDILAGADTAEVVLGYRLRWEQVVRVVLDSFAGAGHLEAPVLLGLGDDVLELEVGEDHPEVLAALMAARAQLATRDDPRAPLVDEGPPAGAP